METGIHVFFSKGRAGDTMPCEPLYAPSQALIAKKRPAYFEDSAYFPFFEEPNAFNKAMLQIRTQTPPYDELQLTD